MKIKSLFIGGFIVAILICVFSFIALAKPTDGNIKSIVQIILINPNSNYIYTGSGEIIDDNGHILTNYHVIQPAVDDTSYQIVICFTISDQEIPSCVASGSLIENANNIKFESGLDLALLNISSINENGTIVSFTTYKTEHNLSHINFDTTNLSNYGVDLGDQVQILGYPAAGGGTITYTQGSVSGFNSLKDDQGKNLPWQIKTDAKINSGNSGGAAFDSQNVFIGVPESVAGGQGNIGYIISLPVINLFIYETLGTNISLATSSCPANSALNGANQCICNTGYVSDLSGNNCVTFSQACQGRYGSNSWGDANYCYCNQGFVFNSDKTYCIQQKTTTSSTSPVVPPVSSHVSPPAPYSFSSPKAFISFSDVDDSTKYKESIDNLIALNIVNGYSDGTFKPNNKINRAELIKILIRAKFGDSFTIKDNNCFKDVNNIQWYSKYVCYAKINNIIQGYQDGNFSPNSNVLYSEALKMTLETYGLKPINPTSPWYLGYLDIANKYGINIDQIDPNEEITRGEMAALVSKTINSSVSSESGSNEYFSFYDTVYWTHLKYPANFKRTPLDVNSGFQEFKSPDGQFIIELDATSGFDVRYGDPDYDNRINQLISTQKATSLNQLLEEEKNKHKDFSTVEMMNNYFVLSGVESGQLKYIKVIKGVFGTPRLSLTLPLEKKAKYDEIIQKILSSFVG